MRVLKKHEMETCSCFPSVEQAKNRQSIQSCSILVRSGPFPFACCFLAHSCVEFGQSACGVQ